MDSFERVIEWIQGNLTEFDAGTIYSACVASGIAVLMMVWMWGKSPQEDSAGMVDLKEEAKEPKAPIRITPDELSMHDGSVKGKAIYIGIKGKIYDVSRNAEAYGPGGAYSVFTGRDSSKALGKSSLDKKDCVADISDLSDKELGVLDDWESYFQNKYPCVGNIVSDESSKL